jgi:hypothetical protein
LRIDSFAAVVKCGLPDLASALHSVCFAPGVLTCLGLTESFTAGKFISPIQQESVLIIKPLGDSMRTLSEFFQNYGLKVIAGCSLILLLGCCPF